MESINHCLSLLGLYQRWQWTTIPASSNLPALVADVPAEFITIFSQPSPQHPIPLSTCQGYWRQDKESGHWLLRIEHHHTVFDLSNLSTKLEDNEWTSLRIEKMITFVTVNKMKTGNWWHNQVSNMAIVENA